MDIPSFPLDFFQSFHLSFLQPYRFATRSHLP
jgi:hypothetical protein